MRGTLPATLWQNTISNNRLGDRYNRTEEKNKKPIATIKSKFTQPNSTNVQTPLRIIKHASELNRLAYGSFANLAGANS